MSSNLGVKTKSISIGLALLIASQTCQADETYLTELIPKLYKAMTAEVLSYCYNHAPSMYSTLKEAEQKHNKEFELALNAWAPYQDMYAKVRPEQALEAERDSLTFAQQIIAEAKQYEPLTYCDHLAASLHNKNQAQILGSLKSYEQAVENAAQ